MLGLRTNRSDGTRTLSTKLDANLVVCLHSHRILGIPRIFSYYYITPLLRRPNLSLYCVLFYFSNTSLLIHPPSMSNQ